jgi:uncharacterized SAM-binding protein YcdF (DUF218 family)
MKKLWQKRAIRIAVYSIAVIIIAALSIKPILRGIGRWLNATDPTEQTAMCFVLGGNSYERGLAAVELWHMYPEQKFITTGGNYPYQIMCLDTMMLESELTRHWMIHSGVPASSIDTLSSAHSTQDESNEILSWCKGHGVNNITVISSAFHMRRVRMVFEDKFDDAARAFMAVALLYDEKDLTPQALVLAEQAYRRADNTADADRAREELQRRYPDFKPPASS